VKIRENRLRVLQQLQSDQWYERKQIKAEFSLLHRMVEEGLLESKIKNKEGENFTYIFRLKEAKLLQHA
jgi:hypothetical protein